MSTALEPRTTAQVAQADDLDPRVIEELVINGDLGRLTSKQKVEYFLALCKALGLNHLGAPFQSIAFDGREILYATKSATEQLRFLHRVSLSIVDSRVVGDVLIVTARATMPSGRTDESTGAVSLLRSWYDKRTGVRQSEPLTGDGLANAYMKAETKAKRRVTLSICGLGSMVEGEEETVPGARVVTYDYETGEVVEPEPTAERQPAPREQSDDRQSPRNGGRRSARPAKYGGTCIDCGEPYSEGDPIFLERGDDGKWRGWHETCPGTQDATPEPQPQRSDQDAVRQVRALIARLDEAPDRPSIKACGRDLHRALTAGLDAGRIRPDGETERDAREACRRAIVRREELREAEAVRGPSPDDPWADDDVIDAEIVGEEAS